MKTKFAFSVQIIKDIRKWFKSCTPNWRKCHYTRVSLTIFRSQNVTNVEMRKSLCSIIGKINRSFSMNESNHWAIFISRARWGILKSCIGNKHEPAPIVNKLEKYVSGKYELQIMSNPLKWTSPLRKLSKTLLNYNLFVLYTDTVK